MRGLACAAACLPVGFGVAVITGVRPLGGIVLLVLAVAAARLSNAKPRQVALWYGVVALCFVASHLFALLAPGWLAVAIVTVAATAAYARLTTQRARV